MKNFDLVILKNDKPYRKNKLEKGMHGIVLGYEYDILDVLFFNPKNQGDFIVVKINICDVAKEKLELPEKIKIELNSRLDSIIKNAKSSFEPLNVKEYDRVELIVESSKYTKYGIHKGDVGVVVDDNAVQNSVEVDFSGIDENGNFYGDSISVDVKDLRVIE